MVMVLVYVDVDVGGMYVFECEMMVMCVVMCDDGGYEMMLVFMIVYLVGGG